MVRVKFAFKKEPEEYTKKKKGITLPTSKPVHIYWDITYKCPLKCAHCYAKPQRHLDKELTTSEVKKVIDYLSNNDIKLITLTGGEPLVREDLIDILKYANEQNLHVSLITTGIFPEKIRKIISHDLVKRIQFSLDSSNPTIYNKMRGIDDLYDRLIQSINISKEENVRISICTTIMKQNYADILNIFRLTFKMDLDEYRLMRLMPCGIARKEYEKLAISFHEYRNLIRTLVDEYIKILDKPILIDVEEPYPLIEEFKELEKKGIIYYRSCLQGEAVCSLTADGKIIPCPIGNYEEFIAGDIRKDDLIKVWQNSPIFNFFRDVKLIEVCNTCKYGDICKGGCRCAAFGYYGRLDAPDPMCPLSSEKNYEK